MKTLGSALALVLCALAVGCSPAESEASDSSALAASESTFGDDSPGSDDAVALLRDADGDLKHLMTIKSSWGDSSSRRFKVGRRGFVVTTIDDRGRENTSYAFAIKTEGGKSTLVGLATDHTYVRLEEMRAVMTALKGDIDAAMKNIPEVQDPGVPSDPNAWEPKPEDCSSDVQSAISITLSSAIVLIAGGEVLLYAGSPYAVIPLGVGAVLLGVGKGVDYALCDQD